MHPEPSIDTDRIDEAVLALLFLGICERDRFSGPARAWKGFDWAAMERLYQKGLIHNPVRALEPFLEVDRPGLPDRFAPYLRLESACQRIDLIRRRQR